MTAAALALLALAAPIRVVVGLDAADHRGAQVAPLVRALVRDLDLTLVTTLPGAIVVDVAPRPRLLERLRRAPRVRYAEEDPLIPIRWRAIPDDPLYDEQWSLAGGIEAAMDLPPVWDVSRGTTAAGERLLVAVLDDGFDLAHPDLALTFTADGLDVAQSPTDPDPSYGPGDYHGTQVAGVVAARGFNAQGLTGVCPECRVLPIRLLGNGGPPDLFTTGSAIATALVFAADHGAAVINNSWGPPDGNFYDPYHPVLAWQAPQVVQDALRYAVTEGRGGRGTLVVWSAGNGGELATYDRFASDPRVLAVGSVAADGHLAYYSDYGPTVRLVAPSSGTATMPPIVSTDVSGAAGTASGDYADAFGGSSASAAMVSGVAALVLARYPDLTVAQLTEALLLSAHPIDAARAPYVNGLSRWYGFGRVDPGAALVAAAAYTDSFTAWLELCGNGIDDNGDGRSDDPEQCAPCVPDYPRELCDGRDNNCDGNVDEGFVCNQDTRPFCAPCATTAQCTAGLLCRATDDFFGSWCFAPCGAGAACGDGTRCNGEVCVLAVDATHLSCLDALDCDEPERCDGLDNDCDGVVDDVDPEGLEATVAAHACGGAGVCAGHAAVCGGGRWRCDRPEVYQVTESRCDGLDNDCDGAVDEAPVCAARRRRLDPEPSTCAAAPPPALALGAALWLCGVAARRRRSSR
ncbi:MAG: S8 family serine peptidase [Deltaproteobacteria bacterium]|nr:S8 family serine peptidase [Deltaproteobacteria bacterium]